MNFSDRLITLREGKNLNRTDFASIFDIDRTTVGKWEKGANYPTVEMLDKLASFFEVSVDDLLGRAPIIDKYKRDECNVRLLAQYSKLNDIGKKEAVKRVSELCMIPKYTAKEAVNNMPIAAHSDAKITDKELELMRQDIDEL